MVDIIIAFPKIEDAKNIKNVLIRNSYEVRAVCTTGAQVVALANELDAGIIVCGYRFSDMHFNELHDYLPKGFEMLLVASQTRWGDFVGSGIVCLGMPIKTYDLINTIQMMSHAFIRKKKKEKEKPKVRTVEEKETLDKAKLILMDRNNMSEEEAHRYIQKTSMDSGTNMVETAEMIISMMFL